MKPSANSIGGSNRSCPRHSVASQMKNKTPVGIEINSVVTLKNGSSTAPVANMWCAHTRERQRRDQQERQARRRDS